jgi:hypothetical protein
MPGPSCSPHHGEKCAAKRNKNNCDTSPDDFPEFDLRQWPLQAKSALKTWCLRDAIVRSCRPAYARFGRPVYASLRSRRRCSRDDCGTVNRRAGRTNRLLNDTRFKVLSELAPSTVPAITSSRRTVVTSGSRLWLSVDTSRYSIQRSAHLAIIRRHKRFKTRLRLLSHELSCFQKILAQIRSLGGEFPPGRVPD